MAIIVNRGFPQRYDHAIAEIAQLDPREVNLEREALRLAICERTKSETICGTVDPYRANILVVGDSHAVDCINIARAMFPDANLLVSMQAGCMLLINSDDIDYKTAEMCRPYNRTRFTEIEQLIDDLDLVFVSQFMRPKFVPAALDTLDWLHARNIATAMTGAGHGSRREWSR